MSKSKKNTVDPDDIIATYGADVARWFMLSDSPPDRDVIWSDERVQGASRFVQRLWRLVERIRRARQGGPGGPAGLVRRGRAGVAQGRPWRAGQGLRRASSGCISTSASPISANSPMRWPRCSAATPGTAVAADLAWAVREAAVILVQLIRADDAASGRGMLGGAGAVRADFGGRLARKSNAICWLKTP